MEIEDRLHLQEAFTGGVQMINVGWEIISVVGVWGWIFSSIGFILKAFPARDVFDNRSAAIWGGCFVIFYALWVVGMINA